MLILCTALYIASRPCRGCSLLCLACLAHCPSGRCSASQCQCSAMPIVSPLCLCRAYPIVAPAYLVSTIQCHHASIPHFAIPMLDYFLLHLAPCFTLPIIAIPTHYSAVQIYARADRVLTAPCLCHTICTSPALIFGSLRLALPMPVFAPPRHARTQPCHSDPIPRNANHGFSDLC